ncbi:galactose oxidase [Rhizophagus irregularis]|uniref:Galactose oxidase n=1 Tax=Rhizophagus irregularis TaxID=588596 RepID=A0A2I1H5R7_9GLOM|nr:galactose oxidase [Rhizophagus irregularis]
MFYVFLLQFFVISFSLTILVESATNARYAHVSALINDQLFIIGGQPTSFQTKGSNDVFYLDLKKSFNLQDPSLVDITKTSGMPFTISWASSTVVNKDGILIYGGYAWSLNSGNLDNGDNSLYLFNATTKQWTIPTVSGAPPPKRREMKMVSDNNENIFIYGGIQLGANPQWYTDMNILDAQSEFRWELIQMKNSPTYPRADYTATMLPSGVIVYIGGRTRAVRDGSILETELNIKQITLYDTKDATWYPMETTGELIDNRNSHSAVLTPDGKIIIYGGAQGPNLITASPSLAILDTSTSVYTWSVPTISSQFSPPPLILHTADLYGDYMIVAFGQ